MISVRQREICPLSAVRGTSVLVYLVKIDQLETDRSVNKNHTLIYIHFYGIFHYFFYTQ